MGGGSIVAERPSYHVRLAACHMLGMAPLLIAVASEVLAQPLSLSRGRLGNFEPSGLTMWVVGAASLLYALAVVVATARAERELHRSRLRLDRARHAANARKHVAGGALWVSFFGTLLCFAAGVFFLCGAINRLTGQVAIESAQVVGVRAESSRQCAGLRVSLHSPALGEGGTLCVNQGTVSKGAWNESLWIVVYLGSFGRQIGLADASMRAEVVR